MRASNQPHHEHAPPFVGILLAVGAALGFSAKAIFVKLAYTYDVDAVTLLMLRMSFALPFFVIIALREELKTRSPMAIRDMIAVTLLGLIGYYLSSLLDFLGLLHISAGLERLVLFIYPTMVVILSAIFLGRPIHKNTYLALFVSYTGVALAIGHDLRIAEGNVLLGSALVFGSTLTYATFLVGSGEVIPRIGARRFTAYAMIVSSIAAMIQFFVLRDISNLNQPAAVYGYGAAMALFSTVIPAFLLAAAIHRIGASHTSIIGSLGPIATIAMAAALLDEPVSIMQMIGAACVILGIMMLGRKKRTTQE